MLSRGKIYRTDTKGNFMVMSDEVPDRPVVLDRSRFADFNLGDYVYFKVSKALDHVYLSYTYRPVESSSGPKKPKIDLVLRGSQNILVIGDWERAPISGEKEGEIYGKKYVFNPEYVKEYENLSDWGLAKSLGIAEERVFSKTYLIWEFLEGRGSQKCIIEHALAGPGKYRNLLGQDIQILLKDVSQLE
jgi:hypothetical protein